MLIPSRRSFLAGSLASLAAGHLLGAESPTTAPAIKSTSSIPGGDGDGPAFQPNTLFLTWQRDPTTTMTIQWIGVVGETSDTTISYAELSPGLWLTEKPLIRPYPMSDFKVFRTELTDLKPDTNYQFRIGRNSPTYRFKTMPAKATDTISFISGGDCGTNQHCVANNIQAARQDPMFAVIGGDLAYE
ncbi:MAG TPA: fibronectin type III domain-containing protein, partial [Humisphaera sp.]|nr:fibronectin type III domain-containing protein [Humisphaera sp.]